MLYKVPRPHLNVEKIKEIDELSRMFIYHQNDVIFGGLEYFSIRQKIRGGRVKFKDCNKIMNMKTSLSSRILFSMD